MNLRRFVSALLLSGMFIGSTGLRAQALLWDVNGAIAGTGTTPNGTWDTGNLWSSDAAGAITTTTWVSGAVAVFSAGTDATGSYTVTVNGPQTVGGLTVEEGTPYFSGGSLDLPGATTFDITGTTTINSAITGSGSLTKIGLGTLSLTGASTHSGTTVNFGTLQVNGGSITHAANSTAIGQANGDNAGLMLMGGGDLTNLTGIIGNAAGSVGVATVTGSGSTWTNNSLSVGATGSGTLSIMAGGIVTSIDTSIGHTSGGSGLVQVDGPGSTLTNTGTLYVGRAGQGNLTITNGGTVTNTIGSVGNDAGGSGWASISGAGSTWTNTGALFIGNAANSSLDIFSGSVVSSTTGHIGELAGVNGDVWIDGTGSTWNLSGDLYVGNGGIGSLNLLRQGQINVAAGAGTIHLGHSAGGSGRLNIGADEGYYAGGIINAAAITTGTGSFGIVEFATNATKAVPFYLTKDGLSIGTPVLITGPTEVKNYGGYTVLSGANTYTGGTTIYGGTLVAGHNTALGTGTINVNYGRLDVASGVTLANTVNVSYGTLGGNGTFGSFVSLGSSAHLAPGASVGTLTFAGGLGLNDGNVLDFEVQSALGAAGTGYDTVNVTGGLDLESLGANSFTLKVISLNGGGTPGNVSDFSSANPYTWTLFSTTSGVDYFLSSQFVIDTTSFTNSLGSGSFFVDSDGNNISLNFTPVPEPSTYALMIMGLAVVFLSVRRQSRIAP